jgi:hypothetical protein
MIELILIAALTYFLVGLFSFTWGYQAGRKYNA